MIGPPGVGKTIFCRQFLYYGLIQNEPCIYVVTDEAPDLIEEGMKMFGNDAESYEREGMLRIVDCYSWKLGETPSRKYISADPHNLNDVSIAIERARENLQDFRFVIDSLSTLLARVGSEVAEKFTEIISARLQAASGIGICTVTAGLHDEALMNFLKGICDGVLEMKLREENEEVQRLFRVYSAKRAAHSTAWTPFTITRKGIIIKKDARLGAEKLLKRGLIKKR